MTLFCMTGCEKNVSPLEGYWLMESCNYASAYENTPFGELHSILYFKGYTMYPIADYGKVQDDYFVLEGEYSGIGYSMALALGIHYTYDDGVLRLDYKDLDGAQVFLNADKMTLRNVNGNEQVYRRIKGIK